MTGTFPANTLAAIGFIDAAGRFVTASADFHQPTFYKEDS